MNDPGREPSRGWVRKGWCSIAEADRFVGTSPRTIRNWLKNGLRHSRVNQKLVRIKYEHIDEFLEGFKQSSPAAVEKITTEIFKKVIGQN